MYIYVYMYTYKLYIYIIYIYIYKIYAYIYNLSIFGFVFFAFEVIYKKLCLFHSFQLFPMSQSISAGCYSSSFIFSGLMFKTWNPFWVNFVNGERWINFILLQVYIQSS
jgi:hypothetical protein